MANNLYKHLKLNPDEIRKIYKSYIGRLVIWEINIDIIIDQLVPFLRVNSSRKNILEQFHKVPLIDKNFLKLILILKAKYEIIMVSDIYKELWEIIKKKLSEYFNYFIFSYEVGVKKSDEIFWQKLTKKINPRKIKIFIDDKQDNLNIAHKYWIEWLLFKNLKNSRSDILKISFISVKNLVLWWWASGILFTYFIKKRWEKNIKILEKEKEVWWLMRSYKIGNSYFDLGGHALHDKNTKVKNFLKKYWLSHFKQKRKAFIDYNNKYIPFPFQMHLRYLNKKQRETAYKSFMKAYLNHKNKKYQNLDDFLKRRFGIVIYKLFLKKYNKKIWKTWLKKISVNRINRISTENLRIFNKWYNEKNEDNYWDNDFVNYPTEWWFQEYIKPFQRKITKNIYTNISIKKIDIKNHLVYTTDNIYYYKKLISTIPLNILLKLIWKEWNNLDHKAFVSLSLQVSAFIINNIDEKKHRIYEGTNKYYFHKCVFNSNSSQWLKNKNEFVVAFESSFKRKKIPKIEYEKNCIDYMIQKKWIKNADDIKQVGYRNVEYAYPIQTLRWVNEIKKVREFLVRHNIFLLWRFGNREYINFDKVIENSFRLANELKWK